MRVTRFVLGPWKDPRTVGSDVRADSSRSSENRATCASGQSGNRNKPCSRLTWSCSRTVSVGILTGACPWLVEG